ncbi:hypothetical protein Golob_015780 [Gossypium lobatum]|uniref:Secreted protein n=2 Tax=Gossypium TaxID=3633 RepID=A0A7J8XC47_GOSAI|nr:hypothetical protein [Gossypium lobatum]MBA0684722.1 hypothetical protein [Gossypium aridum]
MAFVRFVLQIMQMFQLWMVFHFCTRICLPDIDKASRLYHEKNGESMENICETLSCSHGFSWINQRFFGLPQLPSTNYV